MRIDSGHAPASDQELTRRVLNYLYGRYLPALRRLEVEASEGTITLRGRVNTFYEKQLAISSCQRVAGVHKLVDCVEVT